MCERVFLFLMEGFFRIDFVLFFLVEHKKPCVVVVYIILYYNDDDGCLGFWVSRVLALHFLFFYLNTTMSTPSQHYKERRNLASFSTGTKLIAGGLAGVITKTSTAPLERYVLFS